MDKIVKNFDFDSKPQNNFNLEPLQRKSQSRGNPRSVMPKKHNYILNDLKKDLVIEEKMNIIPEKRGEVTIKSLDESSILDPGEDPAAASPI